MTTNIEGEPDTFRPHSDGGDVITSYGIGKWLLAAREEGATHLVVVCDEFDHADYPVKVMPGESIHETTARYLGMSMQKVMEVYWLEGDLVQQLEMGRCFVYGPEDLATN